MEKYYFRYSVFDIWDMHGIEDNENGIKNYELWAEIATTARDIFNDITERKAFIQVEIVITDFEIKNGPGWIEYTEKNGETETEKIEKCFYDIVMEVIEQCILL